MLLAVPVLILLADHGFALAGDSRYRRATVPAAISCPVTQSWEGIDGQWNTIALRVGTPAQFSRVYISTTSQQSWTISPRACLYATNLNDCTEARGGGLFYSNQSSTYIDQGLYDLWIEQNLNYSGNAQFGYDTIGLGYNGEGGPTVKNQTVGALAVEDFWIGHLGIHPKPTNFTDLNDNHPSFISTLKAENKIPSLSWGYTQGASYRFSKVPTSLTLGGYDSSRFIPNNVNFPLGADNERDLLVNINSISTTASTGSLLSSPIYSFIDSTVSEIWLPLSACQLFEKAFGLIFDTKTQLYLVSDSQHNALTTLNPNITFTLSPAPTGPIVQITLPYAAFDLIAKPPYRGLKTDTKYFPLRRAINDTQYTLGRTFLQEAYLVVDWEQQNFTVSQCTWLPNGPKHIVPIISKNITDGSSADMNKKGTPMSISTGIIAAIAVGVVAIMAIVALLAFLLFRRKKGKKHELKEEQLIAQKIDENETRDEPTSTNVIPKAELDAEGTMVKHAEINSFYKPTPPVEVPADSIFELPGDLPKSPEAGGRELSEKEAIRFREARYNGIDETTVTGTNEANTAESPTISPVSPGNNTIISNPNSDSSGNTHSLSPVSPTDTMLNPGQRRQKRLLGTGDVALLQRDRPRIPLSDSSGSPVEASSPSRRTLGPEGVSPVDPNSGSEASGTMMGLVSPVAETPGRRRFSYED